MSRWLLMLTLAAAACSGAPLGSKPVPPVAPAEIESTLFLIGDAGAPALRNEPVLRALTAELAKAPGERVVVYLGDNVYPRGIPDTGAPGRLEAVRRLDAQVDVVREAGVQGIFIPGNHDWARMGADGWNSIRRQARRIAERGRNERIRMLPVDGCPGPSVVDVGQRLRLIALDTQWWLHAGPKPVDPTSQCRADKESEVTDSLRADLEAADTSRRVVVLAHHPLASGGEHGGYFGTRDYFFPLRHVSSWLWIPLPGLGAIYPEARASGISSQDIPGGSNRRMREALEGAMLRPRPLVWASGHDHNLQVLAGRTAKHLLVSGSGIFGHGSRVVQLSTTRFASAAAGYMRLDLLKDGRVRLGVTEVDREGKTREAYSRWLD